MRVVDGALGGGFPGFVGFGVVGEQADDVDGFQVLEFLSFKIDELATEDEVGQLVFRGRHFRGVSFAKHDLDHDSAQACKPGQCHVRDEAEKKGNADVAVGAEAAEAIGGVIDVERHNLPG